MNDPLPPSWQAAVGAEFSKPYMQSLGAFLQAEEAAGKLLLPPAAQRFNALQSTPLEQVKVVILGQDPYPTPGHAHGLSFSVQPEVSPLPRSLLNINRELQDDLGINNGHTGCLQAWAEQGVLLLNTVLTVAAGNAGSHQKRGWESFTDAVIRAISAQEQPVVFILWGSHAQKKAELIDSQRHHIIASAHPSPLSARRGFFGSKPFSRANGFLQANGRTPVEWALPA
ncbi:uracil-DNA glycosylase [Candidatus Thiothrix sp. Deng01]|uniref:Uracil-DNA glycosylase n=1 Tax=Candidatus Thiothrix phosphatis TaxID=3112415 RepID=A0ABU6D2E4_9GAMM|nr:uracil-DNA glycosylase [Candidatus Thiothrix sp. Deng01]MEB4593260.1 uracil-DNA glycosylase [Candidatus Thiothrix sp. Deng01]